MTEHRGRVLADARWRGQNGIARYGREILKRIPEVALLTEGPSPSHPIDAVYTSWIVAKHKPRLYFSPGYNAPAITSRAFVFTIHDLIHLQYAKNHGALKRIYYDKIVKPAARRAHRVVTVSEYSRQAIIDWAKIPAAQVAVVSNACGRNFTPSGHAHKPGFPYFLYIGAQRPHKNISRILEAFARTSVRCAIRMLFSGTPSESTERKIRDLKLENSVTFSGPITEDDLPKYYRGAVALVCPSLYEGFGLPIVEAMACGTPVLTSATTSMPEVAGGAACLVNPNDTDAIAHSMKKIATDSSLRSTLRAAGLKNAARFDWDRSAIQVRHLLEL
jgi:glycosyltransferase involved in cell wall biosynthesis